LVENFVDKTPYGKEACKLLMVAADISQSKLHKEIKYSQIMEKVKLLTS